ncbi:MAG: MFS transporter [Candidatus Dormibacteraeota bacterium]|nr:MFS transporter [Candidatus Dormibacteraeota bacterium]
MQDAPGIATRGGRGGDPSTRRSLAALFLAQAASTSALTTSVSLSSIVATHLTGSASASGLPATINLVVASLGAFLAGLGMARFGRKAGMLTGYVVGALGAGLGCVFALAHNFPGFLLGSALVGMAQAVVLQGRYAAADFASAEWRGRAVGVILFGAVPGAALAAGLTPLLQLIAAQRGLDAIELGWGQSALLLALGALFIALLFRNPRISTEAAGRLRLSQFLAAAGEPSVRLGVLYLVVGQAVMVMLMSLFPIHALHHGHRLGTISAIISVHIAGMYALAWLSGGLVDHFGAATIGSAGGFMLFAGALLSAGQTSAIGIGLALFLIGLGWNFCFVTGSALLAKNLKAGIRTRFEGTADVLVWLCAGGTTLGGGVLVGVYDYPVIGVLGGIAATALLLLTGLTWSSLHKPAPVS